MKRKGFPAMQQEIFFSSYAIRFLVQQKSPLICRIVSFPKNISKTLHNQSATYQNHQTDFDSLYGPLYIFNRATYVINCVGCCDVIPRGSELAIVLIESVQVIQYKPNHIPKEKCTYLNTTYVEIHLEGYTIYCMNNLSHQT